MPVMLRPEHMLPRCLYDFFTDQASLLCSGSNHINSNTCSRVVYAPFSLFKPVMLRPQKLNIYCSSSRKIHIHHHPRLLCSGPNTCSRDAYIPRHSLSLLYSGFNYQLQHTLPTSLDSVPAQHVLPNCLYAFFTVQACYAQVPEIKYLLI